MLADGRTRLDAEAAELEAKARADIAAGAGRAGDELRGEIARLAGAAADLVVERSLDDATQQQLIEAYIAKVGATHSRNLRSDIMTDDPRIEGYANGSVRDRQRRRHARRGRGRAVPLRPLVRVERGAAQRAHRRAGAGCPPAVDRRGPSRWQGVADDRQLVSMIVGSGRGRDLPAIVDRLVQRAAATKDATVAEVRTAVPLTDGPAGPPARRPRQRHRPQRHGEGRRRSGGARRRCRHDRRHRHRRHRAHPPRPAEEPPVTHRSTRRNTCSSGLRGRGTQ